MTRVSFLHGAADRHRAIASWLADAGGSGRKVVVYAPLAEDRERLDQLLWSSPPTAFVPHCDAGSPLAGETPILLASSLEGTPHDECLINLSDSIPPGFARFEHLVEVVSTADRDRIPGRERFRFYRERGYPLDAQDVSGA